MPAPAWLRCVLLGLLVSGLAASDARFKPVHEAEFYSKLDGRLVRCELCPRHCIIAPGGRGVCRVRENSDGKLCSVVYARPCTIGKEPIEKAPFFHFLPGQTRITLATAGCNQSCKYCQNWEISQSAPEELPGLDLPPDSVAAIAEREGAPIVCLTYSEPVVFFEYTCDIARACRERGIRTVVVTGGYINPAPMETLCSLVDAVKIDLKGFTEEFYSEICGSSLAPVLAACRVAARSGTHLELVNLVVPAANDDTFDIRRMCQWILFNLGDSVPVHFTRFSPAYRLRDAPATPVSTLETAAAIARGVGLKYVYLGNVPGHELESTFCPNCDSVVIGRRGYSITANSLEDGCCRFCGTRIPGVWR